MVLTPKRYTPHPAFTYNVIYVFEILDPRYQGVLKIGQVSLQGQHPINLLTPNSSPLNQAAKAHLNRITKVIGNKPYRLLHTEVAVKVSQYGQWVSFKDSDVHHVLKSSQHVPMTIHGSKEWFHIDLPTAIAAIATVKQSSTQEEVQLEPIALRKEQREAIEKTKVIFKNSDRMLWNTKIRFGKHITALQLVKEMEFSRTLILTHTSNTYHQWHKSFTQIFQGADYAFASKSTSLKSLEHQKVLYIVPMGELPEHDDHILHMGWDLVIIEGIDKSPFVEGGNRLIDTLTQGAKVLELSETPFNLSHKYSGKNTFTWDYIMEQTARKEWDLHHHGDHNPYASLPKMNILTYDLSQAVFSTVYRDVRGAFDFKEFFRTHDGVFVHEEDVCTFLNVITEENASTKYPYTNDVFRALCQHSLWILPNDEATRALCKLMQSHPIFGCGRFKVMCIAKEDDSEKALQKVHKNIELAGDSEYTITLSSGDRADFIIPEWSAIFMLFGEMQSECAHYMQTIFRVQAPCTSKDGAIKQECYVFDFSPQRAMHAVASLAISSHDQDL